MRSKLLLSCMVRRALSRLLPSSDRRHSHRRTLAERMARAGHEEALAHWMPLGTWLAMALFELLFPVLPMIMVMPPASTSKIYTKMLGPVAAAKMEEAMMKMKAALDSDSLTGHASEGVDECIADLIELLAGIWLMKIGDNGFPKEEPLSAWLKSYLSSPDENSLYDAWSWADKSV